MACVPQGYEFWKPKPRLLKLTSFSLTPLSATIFKSLFWYSKVELWLPFFLLVFSLVIFQRRSLGRRNTLINISKYYLATPVISTGYLPYSPCLTSTLNAFLEPWPFCLDFLTLFLFRQSSHSSLSWWSCAPTDE